MDTSISLNLSELHLIRLALEQKLSTELANVLAADKKELMQLWLKIDSAYDQLDNEEF